MHCNNCGKLNPEENVYCEHCGIRFSDLNRLPKNQTKKSQNFWASLWKNSFGIIALFILLFVLLNIFSSDFRNALLSQFNGKESNSNISSDSQNKEQAKEYISVNNKESVVSISCDNESGGSGTMLLEDGFIVTNNHVIKGATYCLITIPETTTGTINGIYTAQPYVIPSLSTLYDIAVLEVTGAYTDSDRKIWGEYPKKFVSFVIPDTCTDSTPSLGDPIRIYGYPITSGGYNLTETEGIISSFADNGDILTSAKIDSGNSGGLAINQQNGCMVGIPTAVSSGNYQNLGVITPLSVVVDFFNKATSQDLELQAEE